MTIPSEPISTDIACCFDGKSRRYCKPVKKGKLPKTSTLLTELLPAGAINEATILDVGCGPGGLLVSLLRQGASRGTGIDLSPEMVNQAKEFADNQNLSSRTTWLVGDAATYSLTPHTMVLLDRMICCYPNWRKLLDNSLAVAERYFGYSIPRDRGGWGYLVRVGFTLDRLDKQIRGCGFRPYLHSTEAVERYVKASGFRPHSSGTAGPWLAVVYTRS